LGLDGSDFLSGLVLAKEDGPELVMIGLVGLCLVVG
jgi:hypothetical protein